MAPSKREARNTRVPHTRFTLKRVRINQGGYDDNGFYFGVGEPMWWYCAEFVPDGMSEPNGYVRARDREHAKMGVRSIYPHATFWR